MVKRFSCILRVINQVLRKDFLECNRTISWGLLFRRSWLNPGVFNAWPAELLTFYKDYISEDSFPNLCWHALKMCALFGSIYLCEQFFSRMKHVKSKTRTQITDQYLENTLRIVTSNNDANIDMLVKEKHCQVSYWHCKEWIFSPLSHLFSSMDRSYLSWTRHSYLHS
jgi:hypothetical protein